MTGVDFQTALAEFASSDDNKLQFACEGVMMEMDDTLFDGNAPFYDQGGVVRIKLNPNIMFDKFLQRTVTLWNTPSRRMFHVDGATLEGMWALCDTADGRKAFLDKLNAAANKKFLFVGTVSKWRGDVQLNVNDVQEV
jgi:hypothetical protein